MRGRSQRRGGAMGHERGMACRGQGLFGQQQGWPRERGIEGGGSPKTPRTMWPKPKP